MRQSFLPVEATQPANAGGTTGHCRPAGVSRLGESSSMPESITAPAFAEALAERFTGESDREED